MTIENDLQELLRLVKDLFDALGFADRVDTIASCIRQGEYEIAYADLCSNIHEFELVVSPQAYALFVKIWPEIREGVRKMDGPDWHYLDYLGERDGYPTKAED